MSRKPQNKRKRDTAYHPELQYHIIRDYNATAILSCNASGRSSGQDILLG